MDEQQDASRICNFCSGIEGIGSYCVHGHSPFIGIEGKSLAVDCSLVGRGRRDLELAVNGNAVETLAHFISVSLTSTGTQFEYWPLHGEIRIRPLVPVYVMMVVATKQNGQTVLV